LRPGWLLCARGGEEALRVAPVEDEIAVSEVVDDRGAGGLGVGDGVLEGTFGHGDGSRVRWEVQIDGGDVLRGRLSEVGRPAVPGIERHVGGVRPGERRPGWVVRVVRIGEHNRLPLLREREAELDDRGLRARHDRHLGIRIELNPVVRPIALGQGGAQLREAAERRVAVSGLQPGGLVECVHDVGRRPGLRVAPPEVDDRLTIERPVLGDPRE
jgi:hypothetical protein